jgi:hypothetical protein
VNIQPDRIRLENRKSAFHIADRRLLVNIHIFATLAESSSAARVLLISRVKCGIMNQLLIQH